MTETYQLIAHREGRWWIINAPQIDRRTQARNLKEIEVMGRDLIAVTLDIEPDSFDINLILEKPSEVEEHLAAALEAESAARAQTARAARERRIAVAKLRDEYKMSAAETARLLGVSRGRIYQLQGVTIHEG